MLWCNQGQHVNVHQAQTFRNRFFLRLWAWQTYIYCPVPTMLLWTNNGWTILYGTVDGTTIVTGCWKRGKAIFIISAILIQRHWTNFFSYLAILLQSFILPFYYLTARLYVTLSCHNATLVHYISSQNTTSLFIHFFFSFITKFRKWKHVVEKFTVPYHHTYMCLYINPKLHLAVVSTFTKNFMSFHIRKLYFMRENISTPYVKWQFQKWKLCSNVTDVSLPFHNWNYTSRQYFGYGILSNAICLLNWVFHGRKRSVFIFEMKTLYVKIFQFHMLFTYEMSWKFRKERDKRSEHRKCTS